MVSLIPLASFGRIRACPFSCQAHCHARRPLLIFLRTRPGTHRAVVSPCLVKLITLARNDRVVRLVLVPDIQDCTAAHHGARLGARTQAAPAPVQLTALMQYIANSNNNSGTLFISSCRCTKRIEHFSTYAYSTYKSTHFRITNKARYISSNPTLLP